MVEASEPVEEPEPAGDAEPTAEVVDDVPESVGKVKIQWE